MTITHTNRRNFLSTAAVAALAAPALVTPAAARRPSDNTFDYEVKRSEEEWRALLSEEEYDIMREGGTEGRFTSPLSAETAPGDYNCKGCDLKLYDSEHKVLHTIGWAFWHHSEENAVLTGIDTKPAAYGGSGSEEMSAENQIMEVHCRRCGSHLGHMVNIKGKVTHCINGKALNYIPRNA